MSSSSGTTVNQSDCKPSNRSWGPCRAGRTGSGNWTGLNIAVMVASFVVFWPFGLLVLYWILSDRNVKDLPGAIKQKWDELRGTSHSFNMHSSNVVFNEFQQTQYDRINEIKHEIKMRSERFKEFRGDAQRRADREEFDRFMSNSPA